MDGMLVNTLAVRLRARLICAEREMQAVVWRFAELDEEIGQLEAEIEEIDAEWLAAHHEARDRQA